MPLNTEQQTQAQGHARALSLLRQQEERAGHLSPLDAAVLVRAITFLERVAQGIEPDSTG